MVKGWKRGLLGRGRSECRLLLEPNIFGSLRWWYVPSLFGALQDSRRFVNTQWRVGVANRRQKTVLTPLSWHIVLVA